MITNEPANKSTEAHHLVRSIGKWDLVLLIINSIIGAGIFGLPSKVYSLTGVYSLLAFLVCALVVLLFIVCFAEVASQFQSTGGPYTYALAAFGSLPGFAVGWLLLLSRIFNYATLLNILVSYLSLFYAPLNDTFPRAIIMVAITGTLAYVNHIGVKHTTRISSFFTLSKLIPLGLFILAGLHFLQKESFQSLETVPIGQFPTAILMLVFAFGGFESVMVNTGEIKEPSRRIPFGLFTATAIVALFYVGIQVVCIGTLPNLAGSERPLADAATLFVGPFGGQFIAIAALFSIIGTLNVLLFSGSRLHFALSLEGQLPTRFSSLHPIYRTPTLSLLSVTLVTAVASIAWSFLTVLSFAVIIRVAVYFSVCAALLKLRWKDPKKTGFYKVRGGKTIAIAGMLLSVWLISSAKLVEIRNVIIFLSVGLLLYFFYRKGKA